MRTIPILLLLVILTGLTSCDKHKLEDFQLDRGYEYYPLQIGQSRIYAVDSIIFDPAQFGISIDTFSGFFRELIVDTLRSSADELLYRVERYYRKTVDDPWEIHSVVSRSRGEREATFTENNLRFVKLLFPLKADQEWEGTAHFPANTELQVAGETLEFFKGWESRVVEKRPALQVADQSYGDVYVVELADFENKIEYRYGWEAYAPDLGLVYQEIWVLDTQCEYCCNRDLGACDPLPWVEKAEKGLILKMRLLQ